PLGPRGAGRSASVGKTFGLGEGEPGGQGAAFRQLGPTRLAVFTVVNAVGAVVDREGRVVRGHLDASSGSRRALVEGVEERLAAGGPVQAPPGKPSYELSAPTLRGRGERTPPPPPRRRGTGRRRPRSAGRRRPCRRRRRGRARGRTSSGRACRP